MHSSRYETSYSCLSHNSVSPAVVCKGAVFLTGVYHLHHGSPDRCCQVFFAESQNAEPIDNTRNTATSYMEHQSPVGSLTNGLLFSYQFHSADVSSFNSPSLVISKEYEAIHHVGLLSCEELTGPIPTTTKLRTSGAQYAWLCLDFRYHTQLDPYLSL